MVQMVYCTGDACPINKFCARFTRSPVKPHATSSDTAPGYDVFREPPWDSERGDCDYYWPEGRAGVTDKQIPAPLAIHMGSGESNYPRGMEVDRQPGLFDTSSIEPRPVGEDAPKSVTGPSIDQVDDPVAAFEAMIDIVEDIDQFDRCCRHARNTPAAETWALLQLIRDRLNGFIRP